MNEVTTNWCYRLHENMCIFLRLIGSRLAECYCIYKKRRETYFINRCNCCFEQIRKHSYSRKRVKSDKLSSDCSDCTI